MALANEHRRGGFSIRNGGKIVIERQPGAGAIAAANEMAAKQQRKAKTESGENSASESGWRPGNGIANG